MHWLYKCEAFKNATTNKRFDLVRKHELCSICLQLSHKVIDCQCKIRCFTCGGRHNSLLHNSAKRELPQGLVPSG
ncbi:hypothetical protein X975_01641, partial [Stegodyphus mimosarum]